MTKRYYYDQGWRVLADADEDDDLLREYVYGNYLDEVLLVRDVTASEDYYYAHDHLYSPVALMNGSGGILERYEYDAYGRLTAYTDDGADDTWFTGDDTVAGVSARGNVIAFTGQRLDVLDGGDLKLMYYKNRYYDGETGRFLTRDPIGYADGMNLYQYVQSSPTYGLDPEGLINCMVAMVNCSMFPQHECCNQRGNNPWSDDPFGGGVGPSVSNPPASGGGGFRGGFSGCDSCQENALQNDFNRAVQQMEDLKKEIEKAIKNDKGQYPWFTKQKLQTALKTLDKAQDRLENAEVKCGCDPALDTIATAWVYPSGNTVNLCSNYWQRTEDSQSATLVHEATHLGSGTSDYYFLNQSPQTPPHNVGFRGYEGIASTYDTWILTGFCIPGENCPSQVSVNRLRSGQPECPPPPPPTCAQLQTEVENWLSNP